MEVLLLEVLKRLLTYLLHLPKNKKKCISLFNIFILNKMHHLQLRSHFE